MCAGIEKQERVKQEKKGSQMRETHPNALFLALKSLKPQGSEDTRNKLASKELKCLTRGTNFAVKGLLLSEKDRGDLSKLL